MAQFTIEQIIKALREHNGVAIDSHNNHGIKIEAIAQLGDREIVAFPANVSHFSLNSMFINAQGKPCVSTYSNGIMMPEYLIDGSFENGVAEYNNPKSHTPGLSYWKLTRLTYVIEKDSSDFKTVAAALAKNDGVALDDHLRYCGDIERQKVDVEVIASLNGKAVYLSDHFNGCSFSVNSMYVDEDGTVHISKNSCAVLRYEQGKTLTETIKRHNSFLSVKSVGREITDITYRRKKMGRYEGSGYVATLVREADGMYCVQCGKGDEENEISNHTDLTMAIKRHKRDIDYIIAKTM